MAGQTRTGHLTLRTKNGKRFNWWIPIEDIKAKILDIHYEPSNKVEIVRSENQGTYHVSYYGEVAKLCNEIDFEIRPWSELSTPNTKDF